MPNKFQSALRKASDHFFRLKPLVACIRGVVTGGMLAGSAVPAYAELPIPVGGAGFATFGSASNQVIGDTLRIDQQTDRAILNWQSFNVGHNNTVQFKQPAPTSIALNRIQDQNPSTILGTITANGQIYLVNPNGFLFDKGSVVNVNTLVASALNISDDAFTKGIIRVFDLNRGDQSLDQAAFTGQADGLYKGVKAGAEIKVEAGAKIQADKNGNIILAAPTVTNSGSISAGESGQILLVASKDKVYLQPASGDSPFAGLLVEVGSGGQASNKAGGEISVNQGNVTLAGFAVNQEGRISATTSVSKNGSIRLLAREKAEDSLQNATFKLRATKTDRSTDLDGLGKEATVTFGKNSSVEILADANGGSAIDEQEQRQSYVEVSANKIHMETGSSIVATSGNVNLTATNNLVDPLTGKSGRIQLDSGSRIDVSGSKNVSVPMARNVADVSVQSFNLRDAPYQRGGVLQGATVQVDVRKLPTIIDASGASAGIKRTIDERLAGEIKITNSTGQEVIKANSGSVNLTSSGDVVVNNGAVIDVSGGSVSYSSGFVNTTKLINEANQIVDIAKADPNVLYTSIYGIVNEEHAKWGVTDTFNASGVLGSAQFEQGYTEGMAAGSLNIQSPLLLWNGQLNAGSVSSIYQRNDPVPGGTFTFNQGDNAGVRVGQFLSSQNVLFQTQQPFADINFKDPFPTKSNNQAADLVFSPAFVNQSGLSSLTIKSGSNISLAEKVVLSLPVLSTVKLEAPSINVNGSIYSAGGTVQLNSIATGLANTGKINLADSSVLDVSGRWVNDFQKGLTAPLNEFAVIDGGTVSINANSDLTVNNGATIKADGGAWLNSTGSKLTAGNAGNIDLSAGTPTVPGVLHVNGRLSAYGLYDGGSLTLSSNKINVGSKTGDNTALNLGVTNGQFDISGISGFNTVNLVSNAQAITVKAGTALSLAAQNRVLAGNYRNQASAKSIAGFSVVKALPENLRKPLTFGLQGKSGVTLETGSSIRADKESTVNVSASNLGTGIYIDGLIAAPAGSINLALKASDPSRPFDPGQSIWLGSHAILTTRGTTRLNPVDPFGNTTGEVLNGGSVTMKADRGYVVLQQGSSIDVSGTSANLDLPVSNTSGFGVQYASRKIGSDAGSINIRAAEGIVLDGSLAAKSGSASNRGGRLDLILDRNQRDEQGVVFPINALHIDVAQHDQTSLASNAQFGAVIPSSLNGAATLSSDELARAGFDDLHLVVPYQINAQNPAGEIRFIGDVNLRTASSINIDAQTTKWEGLNGSSTGLVNLNTAYFQLGSSTIGNVIGASALGGGTLTANAMWTQITGASLLTGFNQINLNNKHDLRAVGFRLPGSSQRGYTGSLSTAADLNMAASQIYPSTLSNFTFAVTSPTGKLTVSGSNTDATPLSAAGKLVLNAPVIEQNGVLKAPLGTIELNALSSLTFGKGSLTSVSADGKIIPLGVIDNNVWKYPLESITNLVFNELPDNATLGEKHLVLKSPAIEFKPGSIVDVSGNGDLQAAQFQPGNGGSFDYLNPSSPSYQGSFAILPSLGSSLAPYDHYQTANFLTANPGYSDPRTSVYLSGTGSLAAGYYTVLPAYYALLPGAYLVTPQANTQNILTNTHNAAGLPIISGYQTIAGTNARDPHTSGYLIETSSQVKLHSEYNIQNANSFFARQAAANNAVVPILPADAGQISIDASTKLILEGQFKVAAKNGRGAKMDISAKDIAVVDQLSAGGSSGTLQILGQDLNNLKVDSLLLGGTRSIDNATGTTGLTVTADNVSFDKGVQLQMLDLIAVGKNNVEVKNGATITASGAVNTGDSIINLKGDSALLRVSADKQITLNRSPSQGITGSLLIDEGAVLKATKSMLLDASKSTVLNGDIDMQGGSLGLTANSINIGEINAASSDSLDLSNQKLSALAVDDLVLTSRSSINFYGNVGQFDGSGTLAPIKFKNLVLDAAALLGFENNAKASRLQADTMVLQNSHGASAGLTGTGTGTLDLIANQYSQGAGNFGFNGFNAVNINVAEQFTGTGNSFISMASDLNLTAGVVTTINGRSLTIDAGSGSGHDVLISGNSYSSPSISSDFGGSITVNANKITLTDAKVLLPSGSLKLQAQTGDILIDGQSNINLAGRAVNFADTHDYTPGGTFSAVSDHGNVILARDSNLDISKGGGSAAGGNLLLKAPEKTIALLGNIKASGSSANIDVSDFALTAGFDSLANKLMTAGVSNALYFRVRNADIIQTAGNVLKADTLELVADKGAIDIFGTLNADGLKEGGVINLYAGDKITLENGALVTAKGEDTGGKILLSSIDSLATDHSGIDIKSGSTIDVSGANAERGGVVTLSALRTGNGVNIKPIDGTVKGYSRFYAQGVRKYDDNINIGDGVNVKDGEINNSDIVQINQDTANYMSAAAQNVDGVLASGIHLRPGIEIDHAGNLTLASAWDFASQRFGQDSDIPGTLAIAATGKLNLNNSITDGFDSQGKLKNDDSWSFQLVAAGADQTSADKFATVEQTSVEKAADSTAKDLTIGANVSVHTGSGDIKLASGGNFILTNNTSTVYNAGRADSVNRYGTLDGVQILDYSLPSEQLLTTEFLNGEYPIAGGGLIIRAGADIKGAASNQFINSWLIRQGIFNINNFADQNHLTAWAVNAAQFQQNIGSFGGGKVDIAASGSINDLSVMMPTTGKQQGLDFNHNTVVVSGGGQMQVKAGGDIAGGAYFLGKGEGTITAGGEIKGGASQFKQGPQIVMSGDQSDSVTGDSKLTLNANQGIKIAAVSDAMVLNPNDSEFFTYTDKSSLAVKSLSGDVHLNADTQDISQTLGIVNEFNQLIAEVYPASLDVTAFNGSVTLDHDIVLYPSAVSNVNILAKQNISSNNVPHSIIMSDADPALLPKASTPMLADFSDDNLRTTGLKFDPISLFNPPAAVRDLIHAVSPVHSSDTQPARLVTQAGDISAVQINLPKQAIIQAGRDLKNISIQIQQIKPSDASIISAGRDLIFETGLTRDGLLDRTKTANKIEIAGPGDAMVKTGRNLNLGSSAGISTVGNLFNPQLSSQGASLDVLVGLNAGNPDYAAFISKYQNKLIYTEKFNQAKTVITEFMRQRTGNTALSASDALAAFKNLTADETLPVQPQLNAIITQVFFNELKVAGSAAAKDKSAGYAGGFAAINTLFPANQWQGDLTLLFSKLQTVLGGDINLLVPGGQINAGLAVAPGGAGSKPADQLGIVVQKQGEINAFVKNDFIVNTSRVFTLGGGDLLIWSSDGDIDAGKGAKSALSVRVDPPFFDANNQLVVPAPTITNGSGIRTAASPGVAAGNVFLFAPLGVVNAGEAGIAGNNVTISATAVLGANNIQVSGVSTGVPAASTGSLAAGLTGVSNLGASVSQIAQSSVADSNDKDKDSLKNAVLGLLSVDILGFGE